MRSPARQKRLGLSFFAPVLSGYEGSLSGFARQVKWVYTSCQVGLCFGESDQIVKIF